MRIGSSTWPSGSKQRTCARCSTSTTPPPVCAQLTNPITHAIIARKHPTQNSLVVRIRCSSFRPSFSIRNNSHVETVGLPSRFSPVVRTSPLASPTERRLVHSHTHTRILPRRPRQFGPPLCAYTSFRRPPPTKNTRGLAMALFRITALRFVEPQVSQQSTPVPRSLAPGKGGGEIGARARAQCVTKPAKSHTETRKETARVCVRVICASMCVCARVC